MIFWVANPYDALPGEVGYPQRFGTLCEVLGARGHRVVWWSADWEHRGKRKRSTAEVALAKTGLSPGLSVECLNVLPYHRNLSLVRMRSHKGYASEWFKCAIEAITSRRLERPDVIIASLPPVETLATLIRCKETFGCLAVVDVMDAWPDVLIKSVTDPLLLPGGGKRIVEWLCELPMWGYRRTVRAAFGAADGVMAQSKSFLGFAKGQGFSGPSNYAYLGAPKNPFAEAASHYEGGIIKLAYVGSMGRFYDLETVLRALVAVKARGFGVELNVASGDSALPLLLGRSEELGLGAQVKSHGLLGQEAMQWMLAGCHVGVVPMLPSSLVACPYKASDYAMAGLAILNSLPGEMAELLETFRAGGNYLSGAAEDLAQAIIGYVQEPGLLHAHREGARKLAEVHFDRAKTYPALAEWLEGLVALEK